MDKKAEEPKAEEPKAEKAKKAPSAEGGQPQKKEGKVRRPSAKKRDIQNNKRRLINKSFQSKTKKAIRTLRTAVQKKEETSKIKSKLSLIHSLLDKGVKKGILKANLASRNKSRLAALLQKKA
jgi:small subunit ribosomal protein S20